jgi:catechol 2,3-dioxygenase-like lactoylglutathione lyase family enzyme
MTVTMRAPLEVGICVANLERAAAFYQSAIGFERISEATLSPERAAAAGFGPVAFRMVRMQTNYGERIKLIETTPGPDADEMPDSILGRAGISYLTFVVTDIEAALQRLKQSGVEMLSPQPIQTRPGTRLIFFRDSEGNPLELVQYDDLAAYRPDI